MCLDPLRSSGAHLMINTLAMYYLSLHPTKNPSGSRSSPWQGSSVFKWRAGRPDRAVARLGCGAPAGDRRRGRAAGVRGEVFTRKRGDSYCKEVLEGDPRRSRRCGPSAIHWGVAPGRGRTAACATALRPRPRRITQSGVFRFPGTTPAMRPPDRLGGRAARGPLPSATPSTRIRGAGRRTRGPRIRPGGAAPPPGGP